MVGRHIEHKGVSGLQKVFIYFPEVWEDGTLGSPLPDKINSRIQSILAWTLEASQAPCSIVLCDNLVSRLLRVERDLNIITAMGQDTFLRTRSLKATFLFSQD